MLSEQVYFEVPEFPNPCSWRALGIRDRVMIRIDQENLIYGRIHYLTELQAKWLEIVIAELRPSERTPTSIYRGYESKFHESGWSFRIEDRKLDEELMLGLLRRDHEPPNAKVVKRMRLMEAVEEVTKAEEPTP